MFFIHQVTESVHQIFHQSVNLPYIERFTSSLDMNLYIYTEIERLALPIMHLESDSDHN